MLVSQTTRELLRDDPVPDVTLRDLGEHQLKDMDGPSGSSRSSRLGFARISPLKTAPRRRSRAARVSWPRRRRRSWRDPGDGPAVGS